jgi:hypothetical protein
LECDGSIVRISSLEDIKSFLLKYGKENQDLSEEELDVLTQKAQDSNALEKDDCNIGYSNNPLVLQHGGTVENYKIKDGTIAIANEAFALYKWSNNCQYCLKSIQLPDTVIAIGHSAFIGKRNLRCINYPKSLIRIGNAAFSECSNLEVVVFPKSIKYIGTHAFSKTNISVLVIPDNVQKIGSFAFSGCSKLESIEFKGIPKTIGSEVFGNCFALKEVIIPQGSADYFEKELFPLPKELFVEK